MGEQWDRASGTELVAALLRLCVAFLFPNMVEGHILFVLELPHLCCTIFVTLNCLWLILLSTEDLSLLLLTHKLSYQANAQALKPGCTK